MAINPLEDMLIVTTNIPQLYSVTLWGPDLTKSPEIIMVNKSPQIYTNDSF